MTISRRNAIRSIAGSTLYTALFPVVKTSPNKRFEVISDPTSCNYAPPGEYIKDHTFVFHDGWWHLFSISGTKGYYHGYNGNEETFSWSISKNLVEWEFRGHVIHPSLREGTFDQHEVWAPYCLKANGKFYMFYTGIIHPYRPMEYRKLGYKHPWVAKGHRETQGLAVSEDLTDWVKVTDPKKGLGIPGRDSNVVWDEGSKNWLLYSTGQDTVINGQSFDTVLVSSSKDLINWKHIGICAHFPKLDINRNYGFTVENWPDLKTWTGTTESMVIMKHPLTGKWIMMGNWQFVISENPIDFKQSEVRYYNNTLNGNIIDMGFACEILQYNNKWFRSGTFGKTDYWKLGFTEISWDKNGAFNIVKPGTVTN